MTSVAAGRGWGPFCCDKRLRSGGYLSLPPWLNSFHGQQNTCFTSFPPYLHLGSSSCVILHIRLQEFPQHPLALGSLVWWLATLHIAGGWNSMITVVLFNPRHSMILWKNNFGGSPQFSPLQYLLAWALVWVTSSGNKHVGFFVLGK